MMSAAFEDNPYYHPDSPTSASADDSGAGINDAEIVEPELARETEQVVESFDARKAIPEGQWLPQPELHPLPTRQTLLDNQASNLNRVLFGQEKAISSKSISKAEGILQRLTGDGGKISWQEKDRDRYLYQMGVERAEVVALLDDDQGPAAIQHYLETLSKENFATLFADATENPEQLRALYVAAALVRESARGRSANVAEILNNRDNPDRQQDAKTALAADLMCRTIEAYRIEQQGSVALARGLVARKKGDPVGMLQAHEQRLRGYAKGYGIPKELQQRLDRAADIVLFAAADAAAVLGDNWFVDRARSGNDSAADPDGFLRDQEQFFSQRLVTRRAEQQQAWEAEQAKKKPKSGDAAAGEVAATEAVPQDPDNLRLEHAITEIAEARMRLRPERSPATLRVNSLAELPDDRTQPGAGEALLQTNAVGNRLDHLRDRADMPGDRSLQTVRELIDTWQGEDGDKGNITGLVRALVDRHFGATVKPPQVETYLNRLKEQTELAEAAHRNNFIDTITTKLFEPLVMRAEMFSPQPIWQRMFNKGHQLEVMRGRGDVLAALRAAQANPQPGETPVQQIIIGEMADRLERLQLQDYVNFPQAAHTYVAEGGAVVYHDTPYSPTPPPRPPGSTTGIGGSLKQRSTTPSWKKGVPGPWK